METSRVVVGVDIHYVAVLGEYGRPLADREFPATISGYREIVGFIAGFGDVLQAGMEGTGTYGAALTKVLQAVGMHVVEVNRPDCQQRRLKGRTDLLDAYRAAQSVFSGLSTAVPKARDGLVECLRVLRASRASAMKARSATINQIKGLLVSAPETLRARYQSMTTTAMIGAMVRVRPSGRPADPYYVTARVPRTLATRYQHLTIEIEEATAQLQLILDSYAPMLQDLPGGGTDVASQLLVTLGDNRERGLLQHGCSRVWTSRDIGPVGRSLGESPTVQGVTGPDHGARSCGVAPRQLRGFRGLSPDVGGQV